MSYKDIDNEIAAKFPNLTRITTADFEAEILSEHFFTAHHGVCGAMDAGQLFQRTYGTDTINDKRVAWTTNPLLLLTFCVLVLRNGFTVTGESQCITPEALDDEALKNFDAESGRKIARQKAVDKIYPLFAFRLRDQIADGLYHGKLCVKE